MSLMTDRSSINPAEQCVPRGWIWDIKKYSLHDGPGIRTTVFFKGCPLACLWCCNPESQPAGPEVVWIKEKCLACGACVAACPRAALSVDGFGRRQVDRKVCDYCGLCAVRCPGEAMSLIGRLVQIDELLGEIAQDSLFHERSGGGLTLSGGEPLAQPAFATELLRSYRQVEFGASTVVETSGAVEWKAVAAVLPYTDVFLYDIKHMDSEEHRRLTGMGNEQILQNIIQLTQLGANVIMRFPLIPGCNDSEENIHRTAAFLRGLPGAGQVDILPYHRLGEPKYSRLRRGYGLTGTRTPSEHQVGYCRSLLESHGLHVRIVG